MLEQFGHAPVRMGSCGLSVREGLSEFEESSFIVLLGFRVERFELAGHWLKYPARQSFWYPGRDGSRQLARPTSLSSFHVSWEN